MLDGYSLESLLSWEDDLAIGSAPYPFKVRRHWCFFFETWFRFDVVFCLLNGCLSCFQLWFVVGIEIANAIFRFFAFSRHIYKSFCMHTCFESLQDFINLFECIHLLARRRMIWTMRTDPHDGVNLFSAYCMMPSCFSVSPCNFLLFFLLLW